MAKTAWVPILEDGEMQILVRQGQEGREDTQAVMYDSEHKTVSRSMPASGFLRWGNFELVMGKPNPIMLDIKIED